MKRSIRFTFTFAFTVTVPIILCFLSQSCLVLVDAKRSSTSSTSSSTSSQSNHQEVKKPHIVLCVVDDIGYMDEDFMNVENKNDMKVDISTPKLKSIADQGIRLSQFYVQPVCSPTRSSLMTGRFPFKTGMQHVTTILPGSTAHIPLNVPTLPEILQSAGYSTHHVGKWHLGMAKWDYTPTRRGFSTSYGFFQGQLEYFNKTVPSFYNLFLPGSGIIGLDFWENEEPVRDTEDLYSVDLYNEQIKKVIENYAAKYPEEGQGQGQGHTDRSAHPLFIYMAHQTAHLPLVARNPKEKRCSHIKSSLRKLYCSMIVELDDSVSFMYELLKSHKLWDDTLFLLASDNGGMVAYQRDSNGEPAWPASPGSNWPLRGSKATLFEGGIRVPAFISGGSNVIPSSHRGTVNNEVFHAVDFPAFAVRAAAFGVRAAAFGLSTSRGSISSISKISNIHSSKLPGEKNPIYNELSSKLQEMDGTYGLMDRLHNARLLEKQSGKKFDSGYNHTLELVAVGVSGHHVLPLNIVKGGKSYTAIRFGDWKLIVGSVSAQPGMDGYWPVNAANRTEPPPDEGKIGGGIFGGSSKMLFNITADPEERCDVAKSYRSVVKKGLQLVKTIVNSNTYREPQANGPHFFALPMFHNGAWAPFQDVWDSNNERPMVAAK